MQGLGELEALVMDVLWRSTEPVRVRDVIDGSMTTVNRRTRR